MKKYFLFCTCLLFSIQLLSQKVQYLHAGSARLLMQTAKGKEKFYAMQSLDRYYYDSSALLQKQMYALAKELKSDSIMYLMFRASGNRFTTKTD